MPVCIDDVITQSDYSGYVIILNRAEIAITTSKYLNLDSPSFLIPIEHISKSNLVHTSLIALGHHDTQPVSLLEIGIDTSIDWAPKYTKFITYTSLLALTSSSSHLLAARALQISNWRSTHQFCSACGEKSALSSQERAYICGSCGFRMYPRISPCVIGIVLKEDKILLAHARKHKKGIYSALAGFIEAGETPEEAFQREVREEVNIDVDNVRYVTAQTWPFPDQLMLGFIADYKAGIIQPDGNEILHADWFSRSVLPSLPPSFTISHHLIEYALSLIESTLRN